MKNKGILWGCLLAAGLACPGFAQVQVGISAGNQGVNSFYLAIGDYFRVPQAQIQVIQQRRVPDEQIPVALFIAQRAHVAPHLVLDFRAGGRPWNDVALHFGLQPDVFYVPVKMEVSGPPYGRAYGYWKHKKKHFRLADDDIVNFVNLRFMSEHYGYSPEEIIRMRSSGRNFREINDDAWNKRGGHGKHKGWDKNHGRKEKGRDNRHGHDRDDNWDDDRDRH